MMDPNFNQIIEMIEKRKRSAYRKVNEEMILLYFEVGKFLYDAIESSNYGDNVVYKAAEFMKHHYPTIRGFNKRNLHRMVQFYKMYKDNQKVSTLLTQLSWSNHMLILSNTESDEEREFYLNLAIKENYSVRELNRQLQSSYYQRYLLSSQHVLPTDEEIDEVNSLNTRILDLYSLEFLDLPTKYSAKDLKTLIIKNMKDFILEIGKDFTFIGDEYRVQVGNHDYYIDLLFYNRALSCLVAFELKLGEFMPKYLGK